MDRRYVGIDLHRRRSVIYAMDAAGDKLFCERIANEPLRLLEVVSAGRRRRGGGDRSDLWLVLGGRSARRRPGSRCIWRTRRATTGATGG